MYIMLLMICFLGVFIIPLSAATSKCHFDSRCKCHTIKHTVYYMVDCSNRKLQKIPKLPANIKSIDLSFNSIRTIPDNIFVNNSDLEELFLPHNKLTSLDNNSFKGLVNLLNLTLNNNNITNVTTRTFFHLTKLKYLDLKNNNIDLSTPDFSFLISLKHLRLDFVGNQSLPFGISHLTQLDISGLTGRCEVKLLTAETFKFFPELEFIDISACQINYIYIGTFKAMRNLSVLDISFNICLRLTGFGNITFDLPSTQIKILKANKLHKAMELNTELKTSHLQNLKSTNLIELQLNSNRIQLVQKGALQMLPRSIRNISAADNFFSYGDYLWDIFFIPVEFADLSYLFSSHIPDVKGKCDIQYHSDCNVNNRYLEQAITNQETDNLLRANLHSNNIPNKLFPVPRTLKRVIYKQCQLRYDIPAYDASKNSVEYIDVSYNIFYSWIGPLLYFNKLTFLDMSNNLCSNVSNVFFKGAPNLQKLNIQNNLLGFVLPEDTNGQILQHVPNLREINLSENRIPTLTEQFFKSQKALRRIHMSGNMLDEISFRISHMTQLSHLDLSYNRFSYLDKTARNQIEAVLKSNQKLTMDLSGNPLQCTCDTMPFIQWMTTTAAKFNKLSSYHCKLSNGERQPLSNPQRVLETLQKQCSSYLSLIIGTTTSLLLFLSILISGVVYRNRWKLRYMYYMTKNKFQMSAKNSERDLLTYQYDAFISYEDSDRFFVHDKLIKKLEDEYGLNLCIHKRDFLPGNDIADNITAAIHSSRKTVVILSRKYLDSYWCMFEYNMARLESIYSRNKENILFLVFLEEIPPQKLPLIILELVQTQSYIEFPNDEYGDTVFWDKLKDVLIQ